MYCEKRPFDKGNLIQTGKLISIHFFVGYVKICSSPETFYSWIFEPPKKGNFGLTLSKKNKQTNKQTQIHAQSVSGSPGNPFQRGSTKSRNPESEIRNPESRIRFQRKPQDSTIRLYKDCLQKTLT